MRAVVQRVAEASVTVDGRLVAEIESGLLVLVGVGRSDTLRDAEVMGIKISGLRVFRDAHGSMNLSVEEAGGSVLVVSQFTLLADVRKGRRPSFVRAAPPEEASTLVDAVAATISQAGIRVESGVFGASMEVRLINDGPVTIVLDVEDGRIV